MHPGPQALQQGNTDGARIYAANAIRKKNESLNLLRLASRVDAVSSRVETAVTMRQVSGNMASVVKGMDKAMESMNLERVRPRLFRAPRAPLMHPRTPPRTPRTLHARPQISMVMDKFESQFSDLDVQTSYMEETMSNTTAVSTPQDEVDALLKQTAEEANIELQHDLASREAPAIEVPKEKVGEEDDMLAARLRALRPAT